jgi:hypothetical protein
MKIIEKILNYLPIIVIVLFILLVISVLRSCQSKIDIGVQLKAAEQQRIAAIDSVKRIVTKKDTFYVEKSVVDHSGFIKTDFFNQLSKDKQDLYKQWVAEKKLLAGAQAKIVSQDSLIEKLKYGKNVTISDSNVCFKKGSYLSLTKPFSHLQYKDSLIFKDSLIHFMSYKYSIGVKFDILSQQKDGSTIIRYKLNDPNAKVVESESAVNIPAPKGYTLLKIKNTILTIGIPVVFLGGIYLGARYIK